MGEMVRDPTPWAGHGVGWGRGPQHGGPLPPWRPSEQATESVAPAGVAPPPHVPPQLKRVGCCAALGGAIRIAIDAETKKRLPWDLSAERSQGRRLGKRPCLVGRRRGGQFLRQ